jgi:glutaminyl-tRNA synthetase
VRLKYGHVIECTGAIKDEAGNPSIVLARLLPDTKSGTPGSDSVKVKGVITWVGVADASAAEVRLYDRLFTDPQPDQKFQFERHGYFTADRVDHVPGQRAVFNLAMGLRDGWGK